MHQEAANVAFGYLEAAGYRKSIWKDLTPEKTGGPVESLLRKRARKALNLLETSAFHHKNYYLSAEEMAAAIHFETNAGKVEARERASEMMGLGTKGYDKQKMPAIEAGQFKLEIVHGDELAEKLIRRDSEAEKNLLKYGSAPSFAP